MKNKKMLASVALIFSIMATSGCVVFPANYVPSSVMSATGAVTVEDFKYLPAINEVVQPDQIRGKGLGTFSLDKNVDVYFRDAVFKELRFVGVKPDSPSVRLSGEIWEFYIDGVFSLSFDWTLRVKYVVSGRNGFRYETIKETKWSTSKFAALENSLNATVTLNIEELLKDPEFLKAIR